MRSMTGFATVTGDTPSHSWRWEAKSVNGRGLDLRFRLGDGMEGVEPDLRALAIKVLKRGNVSFNLRSDTKSAAGDLVLNEAALRGAIGAARRGEVMAGAAGLHLAKVSIAELLAVRGVLEAGTTTTADDEGGKAAIKASFEDLVAALDASRMAEGTRVAEAFSALVDEIEKLTIAAGAAFEVQQANTAETLGAKVAALTGAGAEVAPERLAQELALIAVKADIREEIDRLVVHIAAARELIAASEPVGRKLDFLAQEFNREANTLCSKSGSSEVTAIGMELKVAIDQLREQAQNIE